MNIKIHHAIKMIMLFSGLSTAQQTLAYTAQQANHNKHTTTAMTNQHYAPATHVSAWQLSGVMAARSRNKSWSASVNWTQQGSNNYQIRLFGPLGGGTVIVEKSHGRVAFIDGNRRSYSNSADKLLEQHTGVRLPVSNLYYWVRALPAPGAAHTQYDKNHLLISLSQSGYSIHYSNYMTVNNKILPGKIHLQGHGVSVKLAIKRWRI